MGRGDGAVGRGDNGRWVGQEEAEPSEDDTRGRGVGRGDGVGGRGG